MLYKYNEATGWYNSQGSVLSDVEIPAGETAHVEASLDALELEVGATYFSRISVYRPSTGKYETLTDTPEYTVVEKSTGIATLPEGSDRLPAPIYNVSGQRVGTTGSQNLPSGIYIVGGKKFLKR